MQDGVRWLSSRIQHYISISKFASVVEPFLSLGHHIGGCGEEYSVDGYGFGFYRIVGHHNHDP